MILHTIYKDAKNNNTPANQMHFEDRNPNSDYNDMKSMVIDMNRSTGHKNNMA